MPKHRDTKWYSLNISLRNSMSLKWGDIKDKLVNADLL